MNETLVENAALAERLTKIAADLLRASYGDDVERMAAALGNGSMAVKSEVNRLRTRTIEQHPSVNQPGT